MTDELDTPLEISAMDSLALDELLDETERSMTDKMRRFMICKRNDDSNRVAYKKAGYKATTEESIDACASETLANPKVQLCLQIHREMSRRSAKVTRETLVAQMIRMAKKAEKEGDYANARACAAEAAKLSDFYPAAKSEVAVTHKNRGIRNLRPEQLEQLFTRTGQQAEGGDADEHVH